MSVIAQREPLLSFPQKKVTKKGADFKNCLKVVCCLDCAAPRLYCQAKDYYRSCHCPIKVVIPTVGGICRALVMLLHFAPALQVYISGGLEQVEQNVSFHAFHSW